MSKAWNHHVFTGYCCNSVCNCCYGTCLSPCAAASLKSEFDGSQFCYNLWWLCNPCPIVSCFNYALLRNYIRKGYGINGDPEDDCLLSACCTSCVITQLLNEVTERGMAPLAPKRINTIAYDIKSEIMPCMCGLSTCLPYCCGQCEVAATYSRQIGVV